MHVNTICQFLCFEVRGDLYKVLVYVPVSNQYHDNIYIYIYIHIYNISKYVYTYIYIYIHNHSMNNWLFGWDLLNWLFASQVASHTDARGKKKGHEEFMMIFPKIEKCMAISHLQKRTLTGRSSRAYHWPQPGKQLAYRWFWNTDAVRLYNFVHMFSYLLSFT